MRTLVLIWISVVLFGCANKDWYIHLVAHPKMDVDVSVGRGKTDTIHKIVEEDHAQ